MNSMTQFEIQLKALSDNDLYNTAKSCLEMFANSSYNNQRKLELIYHECKKRNRKIYEKALNDAYFSRTNLETDFSSSSNLEIVRIDFMNENEIDQLINTISKGYKKGQFVLSAASEINLNKLLGIPKEHLIIYMVSGNSMIEEGIKDGDLVIADRRVQITKNKLVILKYKDELFIKRLVIEKGILWLYSANDKIEPYRIKKSDKIQIIAKVKNLIKILQ